jgi:hypothetical protein
MANVYLTPSGREVRIWFYDLKPAKRNSLISHERLTQLLHYDPETGDFTWKVVKNSAKPGMRTGFHSSFGYLRMKLDGRTYLAHRLALFYVNGEWPNVVDHINGMPADNRLANLRDGDQAQNMQNRRPNKTNVSGLVGVSKQGKGWTSSIRIKGKSTYLGYFKTPEAAHAVYLEAKRQMHPGCVI